MRDDRRPPRVDIRIDDATPPGAVDSAGAALAPGVALATHWHCDGSFYPAALDEGRAAVLRCHLRCPRVHEKRWEGLTARPLHRPR
jgi:hypothetical protein